MCSECGVLGTVGSDSGLDLPTVKTRVQVPAESWVFSSINLDLNVLKMCLEFCGTG